LLQPKKLEPLREPRRAIRFTINALQIGECGTVSNEFRSGEDFGRWRFSRDERMTRMRARSSFAWASTRVFQRPESEWRKQRLPLRLFQTGLAWTSRGDASDI